MLATSVPASAGAARRRAARAPGRRRPRRAAWASHRPTATACRPTRAAAGRVQRQHLGLAVPARAMRPCSSRTTRSQASSTAGRWVTRTTVRPLPARRMLASRCASAAGSRALVASSRTSMRGLRTMRAGDGEELALAQRQAGAALAQHRLVAVGQAADELVGTDEAGGGDDPRERAVGGAHADVLGDGAREELHLLRHHADLRRGSRPATARRGPARRAAPGPASGVSRPSRTAHQRALARAGRAGDAQHRAGLEP